MMGSNSDVVNKYVVDTDFEELVGGPTVGLTGSMNLPRTSRISGVAVPPSYFPFHSQSSSFVDITPAGRSLHSLLT